MKFHDRLLTTWENQTKEKQSRFTVGSYGFFPLSKVGIVGPLCRLIFSSISVSVEIWKF